MANQFKVLNKTHFRFNQKQDNVIHLVGIKEQKDELLNVVCTTITVVVLHEPTQKSLVVYTFDANGRRLIEIRDKISEMRQLIHVIKYINELRKQTQEEPILLPSYENSLYLRQVEEEE